MKTLAIIPARAGSKSIPGKNLVDLGGRPLIAHMIGHANLSGMIDNLVVSTDDPEIAHIAKLWGAEAPFLRPAELAGDMVPSLPVVKHAVLEMEKLKKISYDIIILLQATCPLCRSEDIVSCIKKISEDENCLSSVAVTPVSTHPFRMKRIVGDDLLVNFIDQGFEDMRPRQMLPLVYRRAGSIYASRRHVVMDQNTLVGNPCRAVIVPAETAVDIDGPLDLALARSILGS